MQTPTYVAKRIGDEYVMVRVDPQALVQRSGMAAVGFGLVGYGLYRRGPVGLFATLAGGLLAYSGITGRSPTHDLKAVLPPLPSIPIPGLDRTPRKDSVDEASMQSFPASDPPASNGHPAI